MSRPDEEGLPKNKPIGIPLGVIAFAKVPHEDPSSPLANPVQQPPRFDAYWVAAGAGAYGHRCTPHLHPKALGDLYCCGTNTARQRPVAFENGVANQGTWA